MRNIIIELLLTILFICTPVQSLVRSNNRTLADDTNLRYALYLLHTSFTFLDNNNDQIVDRSEFNTFLNR